jgi:arylsulfatase
MRLRAAAALLLALGLGGCGAPEPPRHLVLISVDTLRADHLGCYGSPRGLSPAIDALASRSQRFTRAYAPAPITLPSLAALLTGRYPDELGVRSNLAVLPEDVPTLATRLRREGWRTGAVVSNFVLRERTRLDAGFERYDAQLPEVEARRGTPERTAAPTTDAALAMLRELLAGPEARVFLWVHYQDPHGPYTPPEALRAAELGRERLAPDGRRELRVSTRWRGQGAIPSYQYLPPHREAAYYRAGYAGEVRHLDREVGRLLEGLDAQGVLAHSVVVFTADHGESLGEDDYWFAHGERLSDASVRVPLLIFVPGLRGATHARSASLVDVLPTLAARFGFALAGDLRGVDLLARDGGEDERAVFFRTLAGASRARSGVVQAGYKLIRSPGAAGIEEQLFRLPDESVDLAGDAPERARALAQRLETGAPGAADAASEPPLSAAEREALRSLGYVAD